MATFDFGGKTRQFSLHPPKHRSDRLAQDAWRTVSADAAEDDHWLHSSFDLRQGLDVSEEGLETLPGDLQDAFTKR